jgi:hypothetical protein
MQAQDFPGTEGHERRRSARPDRGYGNGGTAPVMQLQESKGRAVAISHSLRTGKGHSRVTEKGVQADVDWRGR